MNHVKDLAQSTGLRQDPEMLKNLGYLLDYGFQDQFEVQMQVGEYKFSAILKREYLRESEEMLVKKYSRFSQVPFVLFGTVAQYPTESSSDLDSEATDLQDPSSIPHLKEAIMNLVGNLSDLESSFFGKLENEIVFDPIALYREI